MKVIACGDSWAFGAELVDPTKEPFWDKENGQHHLHFIPHHMEYRLKNRYIQVFADKIKDSEVIDLSYCSISNDAIMRILVDWLEEEGYTSGRDTSDLFVSIGWTSPERTEFYHKERWGNNNWLPFGPWSMDQDHGDPQINQFMKIYYDKFCNEGEYMYRWILQLWQIELLLKKLHIKYLMHQSFYHHYNKMIDRWNDKEYLVHYNNVVTKADKMRWKNIDPIRFMHKDDPDRGTAHNYMLNAVNGDARKVFAIIHPNVYGHKIWGEHMYEYCVEHKLL